VSASTNVQGLNLGSGGVTPVAIVGSTAFNGLGVSPHQTWAFRRAEQAAFVESPFRCGNGSRATMASVRTFPATSEGVERLKMIAGRLFPPFLPTLVTLPPPLTVGLWIALASRFDARASRALLSRPDGPSTAGPPTVGPPPDGEAVRQARERIAKALRAPLSALKINWHVAFEARGAAGFVNALVAATTALHNRQVDVALVGGLDTYHDAEAFEALVADERVFDGENLDSMIPGEGGAFSMMVRRDTALALRLPVLGEVRAVAVAEEASTPWNDIACLATGLTSAALAATQRLRESGRPLGWWLSDMTNEHFRLHEFELAWPRVAAGLMPTDATLDFLPPHLGDLGAATLPTAMAIAIEGMNRRAPAAQHALCTASSLEGLRGCVLVEAGLPHGVPAIRRAFV
jgi:3-oxoacyl-[acyl-carrier-protein] synthase-1